ncbi:MAG: anthranilate synthase component I family protein [Thermoplasmatota archaeon]
MRRGPSLLLDSCADTAPSPHATRNLRFDAPARALASIGGRVYERESDWEATSEAPLVALRRFVAENGDAWVAGFLGYDVARFLEKLPAHRSLAGFPDFLLARFDACDEFAAGAPSVAPGARADLAEKPIADAPPGAFEASVARAKRYIADGDVYQVNLAQRFHARLAPGADPRALYARLRRANPAPFAGIFDSGDLPEGAPRFRLLSSSPERLVATAGRSVTARPIAGTRPRGATPAEDATLARELAVDEKERAEHVMLADLARNDLGRVAEYGSVAVDDLATVESYARVHHLVSGVRATLAPGRAPLDALLAAFPGGTITGAPKVRAMEIIDELEPAPRGAYTGSMGYFSPKGARSDWNILIRTLVVAEGEVAFHAGAGVVADSDPAREERETRAKARALLEALEA